MKKQFDYEQKLWGVSPVHLSPFELGAKRLHYCLVALQHVHGSVLEIGCGAGGFIKGIHEYRHDLRCVGVDISYHAIAVAKKDSGDVEFIVGDAYHLPFSKGTFDAVIFFDVLEHVDKPEKMLQECNRVLKKGGILHGYIPTEGSKWSYTYYLAKMNWHVKEQFAGHIVQLTKESVLRMAKRAGFVDFSWHWSNQLVGQVIDMSYFIALGFRGKNAGASVESYVATNQKNFYVLALAFLVRLVALVTFVEASLFSFIPSIGMHLTARKR